MAFYSILFAILFLGSLREVIRSFGVSDWPVAWEAAVLTVVVFNDVLYTSHFIEETKAAYSIAMKITDILGFFLLGIALLVLRPDKENVLGVAAGNSFGDLPRNPVFWGALSAYWVDLILWNLCGGFFRDEHVPLGIYLVLTIGTFLMLVCSYLSIHVVEVYGPPVFFAGLVIFTFAVKPILLRAGPMKVTNQGRVQA